MQTVPETFHMRTRSKVAGVLSILGMLLEGYMIYMYSTADMAPKLFDVAVSLAFFYTIYKVIIRKKDLNRWEYLASIAISTSYLLVFVFQLFYVF